MNEVGQSDLQSIAQSCCPGLSAAAAEAAGRWAGVFKALADPTRLLILSLVARNEGGVCECHIVDCTPLSQPTISYHVKVLKEAGLLACEKRGLWCYYALRKDVLRQAAAALEEMGRVGSPEAVLKNEVSALRQAQGERSSGSAHGELVEP